MTSVSATHEKWQSLERKLRRGKTLEQAAEEAGVAVEEAEDWLEARREGRGIDDDSLLLAGAEAFHHGLAVLMELSKIRTGRVGTMTEHSDTGGTTTKFDHPDLPAAQELVRTALKIKQLCMKKDARPGDQEDLFDRTPTHGTNWTFTKKDA